MFAPHVSCPHVFLRPTCVPRASSWFIFAVLLLVFSFWNRLSLFLSVLLPVFDYSLFIIKACFLFLSLPASVYIASQCSCNVEVAQRTRKTQICRWRLKKCQGIAKASRIRPRWTVNVWNISTTNLRTHIAVRDEPTDQRRPYSDSTGITSMFSRFMFYTRWNIFRSVHQTITGVSCWSFFPLNIWVIWFDNSRIQHCFIISFVIICHLAVLKKWIHLRKKWVYSLHQVLLSCSIHCSFPSTCHFTRHSLYVPLFRSTCVPVSLTISALLLVFFTSAGTQNQITVSPAASPSACCGGAAAQGRETLSSTLAPHPASSRCPRSYSKSLTSLQRTHCSWWMLVCTNRVLRISSSVLKEYAKEIYCRLVSGDIVQLPVFTTIALLSLSLFHVHTRSEWIRQGHVSLGTEGQTGLHNLSFSLWEDSQCWLQSLIHLQCNAAVVEAPFTPGKSLNIPSGHLPMNHSNLFTSKIPANSAGVTVERDTQGWARDPTTAINTRAAVVINIDRITRLFLQRLLSCSKSCSQLGNRNPNLHVLPFFFLSQLSEFAI